MPTIIAEHELRQLVANNDIIQDGSEKCAEGVKYDFRLGDRFIKAPHVKALAYDELQAMSTHEKQLTVIQPGEVVYVMTKEVLDVPINIKIDLHEKRKLAHEGIAVLGGRSVDPGYKGRLFFGLQNISGRAWPLEPGRKLIGSTFYRLFDTEITADANVPEPLYDFPERLSDFVERFTPANTQQLANDVKELGTKVEGVRKLTEDVEKLTNTMEGLDKKVDGVTDSLKKVSKTYSFLKWLGITILVAAVGAVIARIINLI